MLGRSRVGSAPFAVAKRLAFVLLHAFCFGGAFEISDAVAAPKLVLAHYMICCPLYGHDETVDEFQAEIREARQSGIDGFAINIAGWAAGSYYQTVTRKMITAASRMTGFKILFSLDNLPADQSLQIVTEFASSPTILRVEGRVVISSFGGDRAWFDELTQKLLTVGVETTIVPAMYYPTFDLATHRKDVNLDVAVADKVMDDIPGLGGYFYFGAANDPEVLSDNIRAIVNTAHSRGKIAMVGVSPFYKGFGKNSRVFETHGFEGMGAEWEAAISSDADWVELITWNDWGEGTYLAAIGASSTAIWSGHWGNLLDHSGYRAASAYFADWFKAKTRPPIDYCRVFYFYQVHPSYALGIVDPFSRPPVFGRPKNWNKLDGMIHLTGICPKPARVDVTVGGEVETVYLDSGVSSRRARAGFGKVALSVQIGNHSTYKELELGIDLDGARGNHNYFSGVLEVEQR